MVHLHALHQPLAAPRTLSPIRAFQPLNLNNYPELEMTGLLLGPRSHSVFCTSGWKLSFSVSATAAAAAAALTHSQSFSEGRCVVSTWPETITWLIG